MYCLPEVSWWEVMVGQRLEGALDHRRRLCVHVLMQQAEIAAFLNHRAVNGLGLTMKVG